MGKKTHAHDSFADREAQKYENPIHSREYILQYLSEHGKPTTFRQIAYELDLTTPDQKEALRRRLLAMVRDGQLHQNRRGAFGLIDHLELIPGSVIGHKDGFGFVVPDDGSDDLFLSARQMRTVFHEDKVLVRVAGIDHRGRREAIVVEVIERNTHQLVGRFFSESGITFIQPSNMRIAQDILIPADATLNAQPEQMVVVEITEYPSSKTRALGKVIEILGEHMAPGMEIDVAIRNHDLPHVWPDNVIREAKKFAAEVPEKDMKGRLDLRHLPFVTIDGEDAKDFDDAVYCKPRGSGGWTLYVAIADVSHYVKPNTALDQEALNRGNSVYFPQQVIPMLPEELSNELCSLKPQVNRLAQVCEMSISATGKITRYHFHESVIHSHARLTYNQVYAMVKQGDKHLQQLHQALLPHLNELFTIFNVLHAARKKRGAIDFDLPETKIIFGAGRKIEKIVPLQRNDAHRVIEECMLCANICAAQFLLKNQAPGLFRVHEGPTAQKLEDLRKFLSEIGLKFPSRKEPTPRDYGSLLKAIELRPDAHVIETVLLRSLSQAIYSHENVGHFGLAYKAYTHFTSPIRRYPDLLVHRAIRAILQGKHIPGEVDPQLEHFGTHCSMTERRADDATREVIDWLKCEFMMDKVGEEFPGVISSVTNFGLFVELTDIYIEGLIHISLLKNDYYQFDPIKHALIGERSGIQHRLGDVVKIRVTRVNLDERKIDFMLAEDVASFEKTKSTEKKKKSSKQYKKEKKIKKEKMNKKEKPKKKRKK